MATPARTEFCEPILAENTSTKVAEVVKTARISVYLAVPYAGVKESTLASVFSNEEGATSPGNPFNATSGEAKFWVESGSYDIKLEDTSVPAKFATKTIRFDAIPGDKGLITAQVGTAQLTGAKVANNTLTATNLAENSVESSELAPNAVHEPNIFENTVNESSLVTALAQKLGISQGATKRRGFLEITTEQNRESTSFGKLTTPDELTVVTQTGGKLYINYQAIWKASVDGAGRAAIFIDSNQAKIATNATTPQVQEASSIGGTVFNLLVATPNGLKGAQAENYSGDVTTGQIFGSSIVGEAGETELFLAAGTHVISIQFRATSGNITVKNRKLWVRAEAYN